LFLKYDAAATAVAIVHDFRLEAEIDRCAQPLLDSKDTVRIALQKSCRTDDERSLLNALFQTTSHTLLSAEACARKNAFFSERTSVPKTAAAVVKPAPRTDRKIAQRLRTTTGGGAGRDRDEDDDERSSSEPQRSHNKERATFRSGDRRSGRFSSSLVYVTAGTSRLITARTSC